MHDRMFESYKSTQINTSDPGRLILMLYDGAIRSLEKAKAHAERRNHEGRAKELVRVTDIVSELLACLDTERGGRLASSLASLYGFVLRRIMDANMHNEVRAIEDCLSVMKTLQDGWRQIVDRPEVNYPRATAPEMMTMAGITA